MNFSDERLARRAARGDQRAFEAIYRRYEHDLYRFCLAMVGNAQDAQDALQNTMVKVLRALPGERRQIKLKPWLYRIARNESVEVLRRRREGGEIEKEPATAEGVVEVVETRERLRGLFADLEELPERQRAALVMREMGGLGFEQIGASFGSSAAVARQTVYEARLSLREMEAGRAMDCDAITAALSDADGRVVRRRDIRAHLRGCESCRAFREGIESRRDGFAAIAPLPIVVSAGLLQGAIGAAKASAAGVAGGTALFKSAATVAVVAALGAAAADRGGLIDVPVLGGGSGGQGASAEPGSAAVTGPPPRDDAAATAGAPSSAATADRAREPRGASGDTSGGGGEPSEPTAAASQPQAKFEGPTGHGRHQGQPEGLPPASEKGQETAAAKKPPQAATPPGPGDAAEGAGPPESPSPPVALPPQAKDDAPPAPPVEPAVPDSAPGKGATTEKPPAKP